ncbi:hypothetical protein RhiirC2_826036, partial [Rhizophagus irregularis]
YGFIHFENEHYREVFFNKVKGLRINLDKEKKVIVKFQPVKRKFDHHSNKHDPVRRPCHDLFDNRTHFIIIVSLPSIVEENEIELHMEGEEIIISGKYKELNFDGDILKKLIPVSDFEYTFTLPSKNYEFFFSRVALVLISLSCNLGINVIIDSEQVPGFIYMKFIAKN